MEFLVKEYGEYHEGELLSLYESVGWTNYTSSPGMLKSAYANSLKILGAYEDEKLLGIIRVVGDGCSIVFIQDLLVFPEYQRRGIGAALVSRILALYQNVYQMALLTDNTEKTIQFYKSVGFEMDTDIECRAFIKMYEGVIQYAEARPVQAGGRDLPGSDQRHGPRGGGRPRQAV